MRDVLWLNRRTEFCRPFRTVDASLRVAAAK